MLRNAVARVPGLLSAFGKMTLCWLPALVLCGCTNAILRPTFPEGTPPGVKVDRLESYFPDVSNDAGRRVVKVFLVHGMSHSDSTWANQFIQEFAGRLGIQVPLCQPSTTIDILSSPWKNRPAKLCSVTGTQGLFDYSFYALQWSPLTDPYKCTAPFLQDRSEGRPITSADEPSGLLCPSTDLHYPVRRAWINGRFIKDNILDDGFPDVILYLAPNFANSFRDVVAEGLCRMYARNPRDSGCDPVPSPNESCGSKVSVPARTEQYVFVTHSMGANVLLDTLYDNSKCQKTGLPENRKDLRAAIENSFSRPTPFYMLANQYALLRLNNASPADFEVTRARATGLPAAPSSLDIRSHPFLAGLANQQGKEGGTLDGGRVESRVDIVAFSDPNDDLSFLLPTLPDLPDARASTATRVTVKNVLVRNADELFLTFEDPNAAHLNYLKNPAKGRILDVIFCGLSKDGLGHC